MQWLVRKPILPKVNGHQQKLSSSCLSSMLQQNNVKGNDIIWGPTVLDKGYLNFQSTGGQIPYLAIWVTSCLQCWPSQVSKNHQMKTQTRTLCKPSVQRVKRFTIWLTLLKTLQHMIDEIYRNSMVVTQLDAQMRFSTFWTRKGIESKVMKYESAGPLVWISLTCWCMKASMCWASWLKAGKLKLLCYSWLCTRQPQSKLYWCASWPTDL